MFMTRNFPAKIASYGPNRSGIHTKKGGARYAYDEDAYSKTNPPLPGRTTSGMPGTKRPCLYPRDYLAATCNRVHFLHYLYIKQPVKSQHHEQICFPTH